MLRCHGCNSQPRSRDTVWDGWVSCHGSQETGAMQQRPACSNSPCPHCLCLPPSCLVHQTSLTVPARVSLVAVPILSSSSSGQLPSRRVITDVLQDLKRSVTVS